jgi:hypothetical protein
MEDIILKIEEKLKQTHEGFEGMYEIGYEDALKFVLSLLKSQSNAELFDNR